MDVGFKVAAGANIKPAEDMKYFKHLI